ncbi:Dopey, N-terminal-domain-containing protein [Phycomyces nitens]|nr:Dopey, N-terminal-domain-containing protein [Phycomyces nitens]
MSDNEHSDSSSRRQPRLSLTISQKFLNKMSLRTANDRPETANSSTLPSPSSGLTSPTDTQDQMSLNSPTPIRVKLERNAAREQAYQTDPRFRKYVQLIEKNLQSFDAVNEWADIISFLGRLLKSFQAYPQFPVVPRKHTVAKRLAQCLNPGFPAGVHQKTLDVYSYLLETIGSEQMAEDLSLWSMGLFPFVQYAATHVKPQLLSIFEKHYFPLRSSLRPAMRGFVIALLPVLEEEGSEFFDKGISMIDYLGETTELPLLYSCLWLVMINNPSLRAPALNYLLRRLPKITDEQDVHVYLGTSENVRLMTRAFSATLGDQQLLVQRSMLELLVQNIPLRNRMIPHDDLVLLIRSALAIVLRKDMSLNRRLYAWVLGTEQSSQSQLAYFYSFAEKAATQAIRGLISVTNHNTLVPYDGLVADTQRPYKILISLMDKWEIGQPIVNNIFIDSLVSLQGHVKRGIHTTEILQTANMWLEMVEPYLIWMKLFKLIDTTFPSKSSSLTTSSKELDSMQLMEFTIKTFRFSDDEVKQLHLPLILAALTRKLYDSISHPAFIDMLPQVNGCVELIQLILRQLPPVIFLDKSPYHEEQAEESKEDNQFVLGMNILDYVRGFYGIGQGHARVSSGLPGLDELDNALQSPNHDQDNGDMSIASLTSPLSPQSITATMGRPSFETIRGSVLIHELTNNLSQFLIELVDGYIVLPKNLSAGVDVGKDGRLLDHIDSHLEQVFIGLCTVLTSIVKQSEDPLGWKKNDEKRQDQVGKTLLKCSCEGREFGIVDAGLTTLTELVKRQFISNSLLYDKQALRGIMDKLWGFLVTPLDVLHRRTVELIWLLTEISLPHQIETIITNYLIVSGDEERMVNYAKFSIFWELSESMPGLSLFSRPMMIMLDLLREGTTPMDKRAGETWIRCHLKNYVRLLEPCIVGLLDKRIIRRTAKKTVEYNHQTLRDENGSIELQYFVYMRPFDTERIDYIFTGLATLVAYSGLSALKAFRHQSIGIEGDIPELAENSLDMSLHDGPHPGSVSFLELIVRIASRFIMSEPSEKLVPTLTKAVQSIQLHAVELLYLIISKLDIVDMQITQLIQKNVLEKLLYCVTVGHLDIQQKLMHLLHATMSIMASNALGHRSSSMAERSHRRRGSVDHASNDMTQYSTGSLPRTATATAGGGVGVGGGQGGVGGERGERGSNLYSVEAINQARISSALYVKCVTDALVIDSNRSMLQQWMDFVLATLPHLRGGFRHMVVPVLVLLCEQVRISQKTIEFRVHGQQSRDADPTPDNNESLSEGSRALSASSTENDLVVYLTGLEKTLMFSLTERNLNDDWYPADKVDIANLVIPKLGSNSTLKVLSQIVYNEDHTRLERPHDIILYNLPVFLHILLDTWRSCRKPEETNEPAYGTIELRQQAFAASIRNIKGHLERIFQRLYKHCPVEFIEGFIEVFFMENPIALEYEATSAQIDLVAIEILVATPTISPQHIFSTLLDGIRQRTPGMQMNRRKAILRLGKLTDTSIMRFAEIYCGNIITAEPLAHLWPLIHGFAKDYLSQANAYKNFLPGLLRFLTVVLDTLSRYQGFDDKKTRKDAQDLYQRCVDYCILIAGRSFDQSLWLRRSTTVYDETSSISGLSGDSGSVTAGVGLFAAGSDNMSLSDTIASDLSRNVSTSNVSDLEKKASWKSREDIMIIQVNAYLASAVIPNLRLLVADQDRINSLLNNLVYYVIGPAMRTKTGFSKMTVILDQVCEMARMPFTYRSWRKEVWEVFIDNRFFYMNASTAKKWRTIIQTVFSLEKERFSELMGRITTTPNTAFFTNKDQETLNRSLNLRRLSYVIFCGSPDQYVPQLPLIQEKLVELLKLEHGEMVHVEIYLCLRVMLVRFSQKHLLNFWPVLITELIRLFDAFLYDNANDRPEEAQIGLAGCKFLDLLCALETDAFQIYQWIFIRDTVETLIKAPVNDGPTPIMEMLGEKLTESSSSPQTTVRNYIDKAAFSLCLERIKKDNER